MPTKTIFRDARDGQFVTKRYAEQHPATTERERRPVPAPAPAPAPAPKRKG